MFRLGLLGAGRMGRTHLRALKDAGDVAVTAVAEPIEALRDEVAAAYGIVSYPSLDDLLQADLVDAVLVATPSDTHLGVIRGVVQAKLPILCEKPCGVDPADTRLAQKLVSDAGVALQVAYWRRFVPELQLLRARVIDGEFGEVLALSCLQWDGEPPPAAFRARSGGVLVDMGVHEFDQARWLAGSDFTCLHAAASPVITDPEVRDDPDSVQVLGSLKSGATAFVSLGRHFAGGDMASVEIFGTRDHVYKAFLNPTDGERTQFDALRRQARAFARFAQGDQCIGATIEDAVSALEAATEATRQISGEG